MRVGTIPKEAIGVSRILTVTVCVPVDFRLRVSIFRIVIGMGCANGKTIGATKVQNSPLSAGLVSPFFVTELKGDFRDFVRSVLAGTRSDRDD